MFFDLLRLNLCNLNHDICQTFVEIIGDEEGWERGTQNIVRCTSAIGQGQANINDDLYQAHHIVFVKGQIFRMPSGYTPVNREG